MKRVIKYLVVAICFLCTLISCSKTDIDSIFNGDNKDAIEPVDFTFNFGGGVVIDDYAISSILHNINPIFDASKGPVFDYAHVINTGDLLMDIYDSAGNLLDFSNINFDLYSVVVGMGTMDEYSRVGRDKRVLINKNHINLYIKYVRTHFWGCIPVDFYYLEVFPKLPDSDIEITRWNNPEL